MGGTQSTRRIGMDNDEPVGVIKVSENVAQRLQNANNGGGRPIGNPQYSNPHSAAPVNSQHVTYHQPSGGVYLPHPFISSTMMKEEIGKELEKNDRYWERRIKTLQDNQNRLTYIMESEFNKAYKEIETNFPTLLPKDAAVPCQDYKTMVVDCFKNNANQTLNCSKVVNEFTSCISKSRLKQHSENRSP